METSESLAGRLEYSLLAPSLTASEAAAGCSLAARLGLACVTVRPIDVEAAVRVVSGAVPVAGVVDYPHGFGTTSSKLYAASDLLRRGAREIETPLSLAKLRDRQFQYLEMEMLQLARACHEAGAVLKVSLDTPALDDELLMLACRILRRAECDYVSPSGMSSIELLKTHSRDRLLLKAPAVTDLESALAALDQGCRRVETPTPESLLQSWSERAAATPNPTAS